MKKYRLVYHSSGYYREKEYYDIEANSEEEARRAELWKLAPTQVDVIKRDETDGEIESVEEITDEQD